MEGILNLLNSPIGKTIINGIAGSTKQDSDKTSNVLSMGLPVLMKAMQRNASTSEGAEGLMGALKNHSGDLLNNLGDFFKGGVNNDVVEDGGKIINHVLGNKASGVEQIIGQKTGIDKSVVSNILKTAAPILMNVLGKQTQQNGISSVNGLGNLIGGMLGGNESQKEQSFLEKILDADGDGSVIDDVAGMVFNKENKKSGGLLGGLLGSIFKK